MFKNCVLKVSVNTKKWAKAAAVRAVKTMAQAGIAAMFTAATKARKRQSILFMERVIQSLLSTHCKSSQAVLRKALRIRLTLPSGKQPK